MANRLTFNEQGRLMSVDGSSSLLDYEEKKSDYPKKQPRELKKSDSLMFLKEKENKLGNIFANTSWSLYQDNKFLSPLKFSNNKTQEDVVNEVVSLIKKGNKIIFLHGTCGTGKSAIALNIARLIGQTSIVVPVKALQRQYEEDYMSKMQVINKSGSRIKIAMLTGRDNHDSLYKPGISCADPSLPENIKIAEKNYKQLMEYYEENPYISKKENPELKDIRRTSIAPANPYWSPILPASMEIPSLNNSKKHLYRGCDGRDWIFYHRQQGCSYYDQYLSYMLADIIIFNSSKYLAEMDLGRKPLTEVEIIDEADDFLDSLFQQKEININKTIGALNILIPENEKAESGRKKAIELLELEEKNKRLLGVDENKIYHIKETKLLPLINLLNTNPELESEIAIEELNYANNLLEAARVFKNSLDEVYITFKKDEENNLQASLVSTNLSGRFQEISNKSKALVFMSGTLHSEDVLKNIFKIKDYKIVEAETIKQGNIEIIKTGKEIDCKYSNFSSQKHTRAEYLGALTSCMEKTIKPTLIHVNAFQDLPSEKEKGSIDLYNPSLNSLISSEKLSNIQREDKTGRAISIFKQGLSDTLFSTKCSRGVDFPGKTCNSIIFTKYPNPSVKDIFWRVLKEKHPNHYWDFYRDKAKREFLQRIFRALRSPDDHVYILSPDTRVLDAVRELQLATNK